MTAGQLSDYIGAPALLDERPKSQLLLADCGYDADWFRDALKGKDIPPCVPDRKFRIKSIKYDKRRNRIDYVRTPQGLAAGRYTRRSVPNRLLLRHPLGATVIFRLCSTSHDGWTPLSAFSCQFHRDMPSNGTVE